MITISEAEEVLQRLRDEVRRVQEQINLSRAVTSSSNDNNNVNHVTNDASEVIKVEEEESTVNSDNYNNNLNVEEKESAQESNLEYSPIVAIITNIAETHRVKRKSGLLLHLVRKSLFSSKENWVLHYFIVEEEHGISWYDIKQNNKWEEYQVTNALDHVPFWCTTYNSRGSRFKRACVCWPILLACDYPSLAESKIAANTPLELLEATSSSSSSLSVNSINTNVDGDDKKEMLQNNWPSLYCFGIEFYKESKQAHEMIVLASIDAQTRRDWVYFLSEYMDWYIPAGRESQIIEAGLQRACEVPMHRSAVLDGEAPRSPSQQKNIFTENINDRSEKQMLGDIFRSPPQFITYISDDEKEQCMQKLRQSTERWSNVYANNTRSVLLLEGAVENVLQRGRPCILPAHYRSNKVQQIWKSLLESHKYKEEQHQELQKASIEETEKELEEEKKHEENNLSYREGQLKQINTINQREYVSADNLKQFANPYEEYEKIYKEKLKANMEQENETNSEVENTTELSDDNESDKVQTKCANTLNDKNEKSTITSSHSANNVHDHTLYKKLIELAETFRNKMALQRHHIDVKSIEVEDLTSMKQVEKPEYDMSCQKIYCVNSLNEELQILRVKLEAANAHITDEINNNVITGNIWSREHHALKTVKDILSSYKQRFCKAEVLYRIEQHEQQTLRIAKAQLSSQISALQETLRNMWECVDDEWQKRVNKHIINSSSVNANNEHPFGKEQVMQQLISDLHNVLSTVHFD